MAKAKYAAGQVYNQIELLRKESDSWICRCHCGNEFNPKQISAIGTGKVISCGCLIREPVVYIVGQTFNGIQLLRQTERGWICRCPCGKEFNPKKISAIGTGKVKSCGCVDARRVVYESGQVFNGIELLKSTDAGWLCRCHCGTEFTASEISRVRKGQLRSCGCKNIKTESHYQPGQRYNQVELLRKVAGVWQCLCHCGRTFETNQIKRVRSGQTTSCGCIRSPRQTFKPGMIIRGIELTQKVPEGWVCRCLCGTEFVTSAVSKLRTSFVTCGCIPNRNSDPLYMRYRAVRNQQINGLLCEEWATFEGFESDMRSTYFIGAWLDRHDLQSYFNRENCFWSTVREFKNRRGLKAFTAKATCPCGNEFHQKSKVDIYCCITCRKKYTGSSVKKVHLSPEQIEEVKSEIRSAKRGHGRLIADKWGIPVSQVWKLAGQIRLEKREEEFETPDNPYSAAGQ